MASYADAFGFTPREFFALTLPQIAAYGRYMEDKAAQIETGSSSSSRPSGGGSGMRSVDSMDELIGMFGSPESKAALAERMTQR